MILKWIPVKWHVILDAEREKEGIPDDIVYYLDCPMPEDGEEIIVTDGKRVWTDENSIDIVGHYLESGNDWKDIKAWMRCRNRIRRSKMNNQQAIDRLVEHLEWGWTEETVAAIEMGIHALKETQWIPISERLPEDESYILVSFKNSTMPDIARYEENDEGGTFYPGDDEKSYSSYGFFVNAWMPLPKPYKEVEDGN